ncbi:MAG: hypothetical protein IJJ22_06480, partial [Oscillospiraceae bacterium]|nr:hypothetical protein [Oscillospiraceae bacterium]
MNGNAVVSGYFESVKPGIIRINGSDVCDVTITKNGIVKDGDQTREVEDYPVRNGDSVYEGDFLMLETSFREGSAPDDEDLIYKASAPDFFSKPYQFIYSYVDEDGEAA